MDGRTSFIDELGAEKWMAENSPLAIAALTARAAARGLPIIFNIGDQITDNEILRVFRGMHASITASGIEAIDGEFERQLNSAAEFSEFFSSFAARACQTATRSSQNPTLAAQNIRSFYPGAEDSTEIAVEAAARDSIVIQDDVVLAMLSPLWLDNMTPDWIISLWRDGIRIMDRDPSTWSHWKNWYSSVLDGKPLDWELQRRVALIPDADWEKGPAHIAGKIEEIKADYYAEKLPQAETLKADTETGKYFVEPLLVDPAEMLETLLKQVEFALDMALSSNISGFNRMCMGYKYLAHTLEHCRDDANTVEQHFGLARKIIDGKLVSGEYRTDDGLTALTLSLERHEVQLRGDHPEVRKAWEVRVEQKMREIDEAKRLAFAERFEDMREGTQDRLNDEFGLDAETMRSGAAAEAQADAVKRSGGRSAKIAVLEKGAELAKKADASGVNKATGILLRAQKVLDLLQGLF